MDQPRSGFDRILGLFRPAAGWVSSISGLGPTASGLELDQTCMRWLTARSGLDGFTPNVDWPHSVAARPIASAGALVAGQLLVIYSPSWLGSGECRAQGRAPVALGETPQPRTAPAFRGDVCDDAAGARCCSSVAPELVAVSAFFWVVHKRAPKARNRTVGSQVVVGLASFAGPTATPPKVQASFGIYTLWV